MAYFTTRNCFWGHIGWIFDGWMETSFNAYSYRRYFCCIYFKYNLLCSISKRQKVEWKLSGAGRRGNEELFLVGAEFQFGKMKKFWRWMVVTVTQPNECT